MAAVVILIELKRAASLKLLKQYLPILAFIIALIVPIAFWLCRNYILFGDFSGAASSIKGRNWTPKPISEMFNHPVLSPKGAFLFLSELAKSYWRGEFVWHTKRMSLPFMDWFYFLFSVLLPAFAFITLVVRKKSKNFSRSIKKNDKAMLDGEREVRFYIAASFFVIVTSVVMLAILSMRYDFGQCVYPSREFPYFTSGWLIAGAILPFLLIYVCGLNRILTNLGLASYLLAVVVVIVIAVTASEIFITLPVFASPYNWFHPGASAFGETSPFGGPG